MTWLQDFRNVLFTYIALFAALTFPYWLHGEVAAPYRQSEEIGAQAVIDPTHIENRKFGDYANAYIPEIASLLNGPRSGWLALWTAQNELGRPLYHISGFSPAYPPTWLLAHLTSNPHRLITLLSLTTCFLAGLFMLMLSRELRLHPLAGLLASGGLAASPVFMYWLTFPMFASAVCWSAGILYALTRLDRKLDGTGWGMLAFSCYSLLMTGYPQLIVFHLYILFAYGAYLCYRHWRLYGRARATRYLAVTASAIVIGVCLALPVYLDIALMTLESARFAPPPAFFSEFLPKTDSLPSIWRLFAFATYPEIFGNPVSPPFNISYGGLSAPPLTAFLTLIALTLCLKRTWGWWLAILAFGALILAPSLYRFGAAYLGFNLSPIDPTYCLALPLTIIAAHGADELIHRMRSGSCSRAVIYAAAGTTAALVSAIAFGRTYGVPIHGDSVILELVTISLLAAQFGKTRPILLVAALLIVGLHISFPMMLRQEPDKIATNSPLVDNIRANLPEDSYFATAPGRIAELPPNLNAALGLPSIHSYNSLSSRRYHTLIESLGGKMLIYGRWNYSIAPDYDSTLFYMSNIALVLSRETIEHANLEYAGQSNNIHFHRVLKRMGCCLQASLLPGNLGSEGAQIDKPEIQQIDKPTKTSDQGDSLNFDVRSHSQTSLLILSMKYHQDWSAQVLTDSGWAAAATVPVNGIFQGVLLPERTMKVSMRFKPFARFSWIAHVFWLLLISSFIIRKLMPRFIRKTVLPPEGSSTG